MGVKTHSQFMLTLDVLRSLAWNPQGMTIGQVQGMMFGCTYGQVKRMLETLASENLIWVETVPYGKTGKKVFRVAENAAIIASDITQGYAKSYNGGL